jgi:hypothetical protein
MPGCAFRPILSALPHGNGKGLGKELQGALTIAFPLIDRIFLGAYLPADIGNP